ncbi:MAG TPA: DUF2637 domain-containing protein [Jatrophihabitantaceae bacterium]|jgi:hypothetical protein
MSVHHSETRTRDGWTYIGILAVAVAAAVLSFDSLTALAHLAGVTGRVGGFRLSWLLPIAVDAYAVTATRVWLRTAGTARTAAYARRNAVGAIVLSVAGNATFHGLTAAGVTTLATTGWGWLLVVAVSAVPPVMLGLVAHLHALVSGDYRVTETVAAPAGETPAASTAPGTGPAEPGRESTETRSRSRAQSRSRSRDGAAADAVMREHWDRERAAGRTPSGAELDRVAGTRDYGRKVRRALLAETASTNQTTETTSETTSEQATATAPLGGLSVVPAGEVSA